MWEFLAGVGIGTAIAGVVMYIVVCFAFKDWGW